MRDRPDLLQSLEFLRSGSDEVQDSVIHGLGVRNERCENGDGLPDSRGSVNREAPSRLRERVRCQDDPVLPRTQAIREEGGCERGFGYRVRRGRPSPSDPGLPT